MTISADGNTAYAASNEMGLVAVDISNPASPRVLGSMDNPTAARGIAVSGSLAVVGGSVGTSKVVDLSTPSAPREISQLSSAALRIAMGGSYTYIAYGSSGLRTFDLRNPYAPVLTGNMPALAQDVAIAPNGAWGYVATSSGGVNVLSLAMPGTPAYVRGISTAGNALGVALDSTGTLLFVAASSAGVQIFDVSNPMLPQALATCPTSRSAALQVAVANGYVAAATVTGMAVIDATYPGSPRVVAATNSYTYSVASHGDLIVSALGDRIQCHRMVGGVLTLVGQVLSTRGDRSSVAVDGNLALVACSPIGTQVIDVANPASPQTRSELPASLGVAVRNGAGYLANTSGLKTYDLRNPQQPVLSQTLSMTAKDVVVSPSGVYAYVAAMSAGVNVLNLSNPFAPTVAANHDTPGVAASVALDESGNMLAVADTMYGFRLLNVTQPTAPVLYSSTMLPSGNAFKIALSGGYAFVATTSAVHVYDVRNPSAPVFVQTLNSAAVQVKASGGRVFCASQSAGVDVYQLGSSTFGFEENIPARTGAVSALTVAGNYAYFGELGSPLVTVNLFAP